MLTNYFLMDPSAWIVPWILQSLTYYFILKKMGLRKKLCIIPFLAEREFSSLLFKRMRSFYRPFIITAVFVAGAYYLGPAEGTGLLYMLIACLVYGVFLARLYYRLAKSFGKPFIFRLVVILFPTLFLLILGLGKSSFTVPEFRKERIHSRFINNLRHVTFTLISLVEVIVLVVGVGLITISRYPPRALAKGVLDEIHESSKDIEADGNCLSRVDTMGASASKVSELPVSRDKFFPDHSQDKNVVVLGYIVGSNLENRIGLASANIRMMKDATKRGDALQFVLETGGSGRWFTDGIEDNSYGRYTVSGGDLEKVMDLPAETCMSEPETLEDFIKWGVSNYPADRYMLVLWDHGGGVPYGFGEDDLNKRADSDDTIMRSSEVVKAVRAAGAKFDVIGFDACLMQNIEIATSFEPCADYYLASEETEPGYGWFYTSAFGMLAENPGLSSEEFGKAIVSSYDQFNTAVNDGEKQTNTTLSFADLTLLKPAEEKLAEFCRKADEAIRLDSGDFADIGLAASNTYAFMDKNQYDLIDFIEKLEDTDVDDSICSSKEKASLMDALKASIVYTNKNAAKGVNGMAFAFPYDGIYMYGDTSAELKKLKKKEEKALFDDVFSIIAAQQKKAEEKELEGIENDFYKRVKSFLMDDYSGEDWYVSGFEDYDSTTDLVDIPLKDLGGEYQVELPKKTWKIITDCSTVVYQKDEEGRLRYLGSDQIGGVDENGNPTVAMDDTWVNINGRLVCYEAQPVKETDEGYVYSGIVRARLNGDEDINLYVEWDPAENEDDPETGRITGYEYADNEFFFMEKGMQNLKTGDSIQFLFDYYDEEGNLTETEPYGSRLVVTKQKDLKAEDAALGDCDVEFAGILTDVYNRTIMTESIEAHIGE